MITIEPLKSTDRKDIYEKKMLTILLAALLCISIVACGKSQESIDGLQQSTEQNGEQGIQAEFLQGELDAAFAVHLSINPEFKIHVDCGGNVSSVEWLNEDAKAVGDKIAVTGKSCKDAIVLILSETIHQEFLKDGGEIDISVEVPETISNQMDAWHETIINGVTQVLSEYEVNASIDFKVDITG